MSRPRFVSTQAGPGQFDHSTTGDAIQRPAATVSDQYSRVLMATTVIFLETDVFLGTKSTSLQFYLNILSPIKTLLIKSVTQVLCVIYNNGGGGGSVVFCGVV